MIRLIHLPNGDYVNPEAVTAIRKFGADVTPCGDRALVVPASVVVYFGHPGFRGPIGLPFLSDADRDAFAERLAAEVASDRITKVSMPAE